MFQPFIFNSGDRCAHITHSPLVVFMSFRLMTHWIIFSNADPCMGLSKLFHLLLEVLINICPDYSVLYWWSYSNLCLKVLYTFVQTRTKQNSTLLLRNGSLKSSRCPNYSILLWRFLNVFLQTPVVTGGPYADFSKPSQFHDVRSVTSDTWS